MSLFMFYFIEISLIYIILGWSIYLLYRNGALYYIPIATMAIGAFFVVFTVKTWHWPFGLALIGAICLGAFFAFIPAIGLARAKAFTMVVATIGIIIIVQTIIRNLNFLGREKGLNYSIEVNYLILKTIIITIIIGILIFRLDHSRIGRAMEITFVDEEIAASLGINLFWMSVWLQAIAGGMGALAGGLYAATMTTIVIRVFGFAALVLVICFIFVGGHTTMWGLVVFTPIMYGIPLILPEVIAKWKYAIYGVILIAVLALRPKGLIDKSLIRVIKTNILLMIHYLKRSRRRKDITN
jgi:branched-chain amino acid transport system permease protein